MSYTLTHLHELDRVPATDAGSWRPVRRALGVTAFGVTRTPPTPRAPS